MPFPDYPLRTELILFSKNKINPYPANLLKIEIL